MFENASLRERTTFRVAAHSALLIEVDRAEALADLFDAALLHDREVLVLGGGSNVLFTRDWPGVIVSPVTRGIDVVDDEGGAAVVRCAAGEDWNDLVWWSLDQGFVGLENLALIPGKVGAAPIQNIGAYGTEVREFVHTVHAFDRQTRRGIRLANADCAFAYRDSRFKHEPGRYVITAVDWLLPRSRALRYDYAGLPDELAAMGVTSPDARRIAEAVTRLRRRKLPDPAVTGNAGSFFKNPRLPRIQVEALQHQYPDLPVWAGPDEYMKLSAAWLIESCDFKGLRQGDAGVSSQHALVLVNYGNASGAQLLGLATQIQDRVEQRFGVRLEPEPLIV